MYKSMFSALALMITLSTIDGIAHAKEYSDVSNIYLSMDGKQISASDAWRSDAPVYECVKKVVENNKRTGKPRMKKAD